MTSNSQYDHFRIDDSRNNRYSNSGHDSSQYDNQRPNKKRIPRSYEINNGKTELRIIQGDITKIKVDAIVNAANEHMTGGAGVDGIIHRAAGGELYEECFRHRQVVPGVRLPTGRSRILLSYNLSHITHYIINTAGPVYDSRAIEKCRNELASCYKTAMNLANLYDLKSIAFPAISCGIFGYPADQGARTAIETANECAEDLSEVIFVLFDDHIYDAWVKMVEKLQLKPYGDQSVSRQKSATRKNSPNQADHTIPKSSTDLPPNNSFAQMNIHDTSADDRATGKSSKKPQAKTNESNTHDITIDPSSDSNQDDQSDAKNSTEEKLDTPATNDSHANPSALQPVNDN